MASEYFIVDDAIDEAGHEGFELLFGDPTTAVGFFVERSRRLWQLKLLVLKRDPGTTHVARVFLARRHGERARVVYIKL